MIYEGTFLEIVAINNGFAVYDFSVKQYDLISDRKAIPMRVFNKKEDLVQWILSEWKEKPYDFTL